MANANQAENCRHEHLPSPPSRILRTVNDVSTAHQLSRKCWLHSWKIAGCSHCSTWKNRMLVSSRKEEDQQVLVRQRREMYLSSNMLSHNKRSCVNLLRSLLSYFDCSNNDPSIVKTEVWIELVECEIPVVICVESCVERKYFILNPFGVCTYPNRGVQYRGPNNIIIQNNKQPTPTTYK
jgi:hypothetical protein